MVLDTLSPCDNCSPDLLSYCYYIILTVPIPNPDVMTFNL